MIDADFERFKASYIPEPNTGCWLWIAGGKANGYGHHWCKATWKTEMAHRYAYTYYVGPIPEGLELDHLCRVRCCVNPDHLEPVTHRVNTLRGMNMAALNARKTHCKRGHELEVTARPGVMHQRICRTCASTVWQESNKERARQKRAEQRAQGMSSRGKPLRKTRPVKYCVVCGVALVRRDDAAKWCRPCWLPILSARMKVQGPPKRTRKASCA